MEYNRTNITYSAADIRQYLEGKMTPAQMNALEKAALDDPFLSEAIEGYQALKAEEWQPVLQGLQQSFAAPSSTAKVVHMGIKRGGWIKYAAAVILLGSSITFYLLNKTPNTTDTPNVATVESNTPGNKGTTTPVIAKTDSTIDIAVNDNNTLIPSNTANGTKKTTNTFTDQLKVADSTLLAINESPKPAEKPLTMDKPAQVQQAMETENKDFKFTIAPATTAKADAPASRFADNVTANKKKEIALNSKDQEWYNNNNRGAQNSFFKQENLNNSMGLLNRAVTSNEVNRSFTARVVDANNNPLPFANINVTNEGFGTYADAKGNVSLVSTDSIIPIEVKSLGYESRNIVLRSNERSATIQLKEDANMAYAEKTEDRMLANNNVMSRRAYLQRNIGQDAEPADGWDKYDTYISNNLVIPDDLVKRNVHGEVALSFDVQKNGAITNIKVDKSLCNDCDEIAKRIVAQGPQWKVKKGKKTKAKVTVQF